MTEASHIIGFKKEKGKKREREKDRKRRRKGEGERENRDNKKRSEIEHSQAPSVSQTPPLKLFRTSPDGTPIWRSAPWHMNFS